MTDVNSASVGIEIVNPGPRVRLSCRSRTSRLLRLFRSWPTSRSATASAAATSSAIPTSRRRARRIPASCSRGKPLARRRLALPSPTRELIDPYWTDAGFLLALERFGYDVTDEQKAVIAFQRRFRPELHRRDRRRRMPRQAARSVAAAPAITHMGQARGSGGRGGSLLRRGKSGLHGTTVPGNARRRVKPGERSQGKCHRKDTARLRPGKVERVRQERTAAPATGPAR